MINSYARKKLYGIVGAGLCLLIPWVILTTSPEVYDAQSLCPFKLLTGMPCPGCGITKSIIAFYQGDWVKSLHYHVLGPIVPFACLMAIIVLAGEWITGKTWFKKCLSSTMLALVLAWGLGLYHLARTVYFVYSHTWGEILQESVWF